MEEIEVKIGKEGNCEDVSSDRTMIPDRDKAFVSVSGGINTNQKYFCLRFVQTFSGAKRPVQRSLSPGIE